MFLTVTANAALDRLIFIPRFEFAATMRTQEVIDAVGGKGYDVSVALRCLGQPTIAVGFMAGGVGQALENILQGYGIQTDLVWVEGETRTAHVIIETERHRHSHIITGGYTVQTAHLQSLMARFEARLPAASWVIASGSLPPGVPLNFYAAITRLAHSRHVPALIDTAGEPMRQALTARPEIAKLNWQEFTSTFALSENLEPDKVYQQARELVRTHGLSCLVITRGDKGLIAFSPQGDYQATPPRLEAVNAAGAGDAASACLVWRLSLGESLPEALRWSAAAGAATVLTRRTAECEWQTVQALYPQVTLAQLPGR